MGLSASQARLLSLSTRQHAIEGKAQAYQQRKMLLANDQDQAYKTYMNALNNTMLKTIQTNSETGKTSWINGTINNLMRNGTANNTAGNIFYIQDLQTGQLYIPKNLNYETTTSTVTPNATDENGVYTAASSVYQSSNMTSGTITIQDALAAVTGNTLEEQARSFAEQFGVVYTKTDKNEAIVLNYNKAINSGWNTILGENDEQCANVYANYTAAVEKDRSNYELANSILNFIPEKNTTGLYYTNEGNDALLGSYKNFAKKILETYANIDTTTGAISAKSLTGGMTNPYTAQELNIIRASLTFCDTIENKFPKAYTTDDTGISTSYEYILSNLSAKNDGDTTYLNKTFDTSKYTQDSSSDKNDKKTEEPNIQQKENNLSDYEKYLLMLNGGELTWTGTQRVTLYNYGLLGNQQKTTDTDYKKDYNVYTDLDTTLSTSGSNSATYQSVLGSYKNFGDALTSIFTRVGTDTEYEDAYLDAHNITREDINKYLQYKKYAGEYATYRPDYEYVPSDKVKANQYEQMYKALVSCGTKNTDPATTAGMTDAEKHIEYAKNGYIECDDERCKNTTWVSNMIKNAQVILTTWDSESEMLSKTSPSLNTKIRQVTDSSSIEQASQEYEAELELIKEKDNRYDVVLEQLESERSAIETESEALKDVINANIEKRFKVFG